MKKRNVIKPVLLAVMAASLIFLSGCGGDKKTTGTLNVYNWGDYIDQSILKDFENETGIKVNYSLFETNEDMYVKLKNPSTPYDVAFPSDYMIEKMIKEDMLVKIDKSKIPNINKIDSRFLNLDFDKNNEYSVPYFWGTVGIVYNKKMVKEPVDSFNILWAAKYKNHILMLNSERDTLAVALKKLGYSMNTRNVEELEKAKEELIKQKPLVSAYVGDNIRDLMLNEEAAMAVAWSGDAVYLQAESDDLEYALPKEGSNIWFDNVVIPKSAQNVEAAHKFIDFLCRADIAKRNSEYVGYSTPNKEALALIDPELKNLNGYYPTEEETKNYEIFKDPGEFIKEYNRIWTEFKAK